MQTDSPQHLTICYSWPRDGTGDKPSVMGISDSRYLEGGPNTIEVDGVTLVVDRSVYAFLSHFSSSVQLDAVRRMMCSLRLSGLQEMKFSIGELGL